MALTDNLMAYWKLNEASGDAVDSHGSNTMTQTGTVGSQTGKLGNARGDTFDASNHFSIASNSDLVVGDLDFTVACWVYITAKTADRVAVCRDSAGTAVFRLLYNWGSDVFFWRVYDGGGTPKNLFATTFGSPSVNTWYHLVAWHDSVANEIGITVNAGTADTVAMSTGASTGAVPNYIGYSPFGSQTWPGRVDEYGFWKRVLTSQERTDLYNGGSGLAYPFSSATTNFLTLLGVGA